jgi:hypothetical protein
MDTHAGGFIGSYKFKRTLKFLFLLCKRGRTIISSVRSPLCDSLSSTGRLPQQKTMKLITAALYLASVSSAAALSPSKSPSKSPSHRHSSEPSESRSDVPSRFPSQSPSDVVRWPFSFIVHILLSNVY